MPTPVPLLPCLTRLRQDPWFCSLPAPLQDSMLSICRVRKYGAGQRLFSRGEEVDGFYGIVEGGILVFNEASAGDDGVLMHFDPVFWYGEQALFDGCGHTHAAEAAGDVQALVMPLDRVQELLDETPAFWKHFGLLITQKLRLAYLGLDELVRMPADVRIARRLVVMAASQGVDPPLPHVLGIRQEHLAQMVGMSRGTVSQVLQKLCASGAISLQYARITVKDLDALRRVAGGARWPPSPHASRSPR
jgi:CRP/FNR family cyclic AMP-dependent transcriptional regulator